MKEVNERTKNLVRTIVVVFVVIRIPTAFRGRFWRGGGGGGGRRWRRRKRDIEGRKGERNDMYICIHAHMYMCIYTCIYIYIYVHVCVYLCML
jgi:hypothetical protein